MCVTYISNMSHIFICLWTYDQKDTQ